MIEKIIKEYVDDCNNNECKNTPKCADTSKLNCSKAKLIDLIEDHVKYSKEIRRYALDYIKVLPIDVDAELLEDFIMGCKFDVFNDFIRALPNASRVKHLKKNEFFYNPDGGEKLQVVSVKLNDDNSCTVNAIHQDNELSKYLFDQDRVVFISEEM